jgi:hypothetical protein
MLILQEVWLRGSRTFSVFRERWSYRAAGIDKRRCQLVMEEVAKN